MIIRKIAQRVAVKKVAAYARVSTLTEAQEESYDTQVNYYTDLIDNTAGWEMAGIYADQGITGTSAEKRPQFMQMLDDAKEGKMNLILCKSISRFSRNFVEAQKFMHELKAMNVEVRFEKEGVSSFDPSSDMIFSTMAAVAQEESRSISENVKWAYRRRAEQGIRHVGNNHMLGYDEVEGKLTPNGDAWIVKLIFEEYAAGVAPATILAHLKKKGARRLRSGNGFTWSVALRILNNECYVGDRLLQKTAPQNYLTKRPDPNEAYESKYIYNDHEPIITPAVWDATRERMKRTEAMKGQGLAPRSNAHFLYGTIYCAECGQPYRRYTAKNHTETYKTWRCRGHVAGMCINRHIRETELLSGICSAMGWEAMDEWALAETVDRVLITEDGIQLKESDGRDYENEQLADQARESA
ncbi:MAG: recombinase family protein [Lachnospiraceae bacterium]|nr:recombinase family protein [Lachnospiraceae bacterium]